MQRNIVLRIVFSVLWISVISKSYHKETCLQPRATEKRRRTKLSGFCLMDISFWCVHLLRSSLNPRVLMALLSPVGVKLENENEIFFVLNSPAGMADIVMSDCGNWHDYIVDTMRLIAGFSQTERQRLSGLGNGRLDRNMYVAHQIPRLLC